MGQAVATVATVTYDNDLVRRQVINVLADSVAQALAENIIKAMTKD